MKMMRAFLVLGVTALATALAGEPSWAQVYKWVDESGVTHYSDRAPPKHSTPGRVEIVADRISVYTPDPSLTRTLVQATGEPALSNRIDRLERQLEAEREARQFAAAAEAQAYAAAYDQCLADRRVDCDGYDGYYSYGEPVVIAAFRHRRFPHARPPHISGLIAGNVVGATGIMPGNFNGVNAVTAGNPFSFGSAGAAPRIRGLPPRS